MIQIIIPVFLAVLGGINYYIGLRGWQWLGAVMPAPISGWLYWVPFWLLFLAFPLSRFGPKSMPVWAGDLLTRLGAYWLFALVYLLPLLLLIDFGRLVNRRFGLMPVGLMRDLNLLRPVGAVVLVLLVGLFLYGNWRARTPVVVHYDVSIPKSGGNHDALNVVLVSDTHLGAMNGNNRIREMVDMVNGLNPDLILLAGDLIDDDFRPFVAYNMPDELKKLKATLGVYSVLGNHDFGADDLAEYRSQMERGGIALLVDEWVKVDDSFFVIGRNDSSRTLYGEKRKELGEIMQGVDPSLPLLLMDHQPNRLPDAVEAGIDLQVSGHTHRGQMFPFNYITQKVFEVDWGYLKKGATHVIVSLGFGTWGPPVRIGNTPEVVSIRVQFANQ